MIQRGRKSSAELAVVPGVPRIDAIQKPDPPAELTPDQAETWKITVAAMRRDWFGPENGPLLVQYCRHVTNANVVAKAITATDIKADLARFARLGAMQARETSAIISLSTKMRLTHQASRDSRHVKRDPGAGRPRPWEVGED
jgi:hypothetical protein